MQNLKIELQNCYGIQNIKKEFTFGDYKVNAIYARNGLMKTSLSKVFHKIQENKLEDIKDEIFDRKPVEIKILVDNHLIKPEEIFVIRSYESYYESSNIATLLINKELKDKLKILIKVKEKILKILEKKSGLKISKVTLGKKVFEIEPRIMNDFNFIEKSLLLNLNTINIDSIDVEYSNIKYSDIFDSGVLKKIKSLYFQSSIEKFLERTDEIYSEYSFFDKGRFTLPKLKDTLKNFTKNSFFVKNNRVLLTGDVEVSSTNDLKIKIKEIEDKLKDTSEFKEIEKLLSDVKGIKLKDILENYPEIIGELKSSRLDEFRKILWLSYLKSEEKLFQELVREYKQFENELNSANTDETPWKHALDIFESRFNVPFKMEIENIKSSIIGESLPRVIFSFCKDGDTNNLDKTNWIKMNRKELEGKNTLSQGERRALYLLNVIFDIEKRKINNEETLFIIDDIADSFDYKNKYAIVEYLKDIAEYDKFFMLILSHNFDFYRTVSSRLRLDRDCRFKGEKSIDCINLEKEKYQKQPFNYWKNNLNQINIIALVPFIRNLLEYGVDKKINDVPNIDTDSMLLTCVLHIKSNSNNITVGHIKNVFKEYLNKDNFPSEILDTKIFNQLIYESADTITEIDICLENKIVIAIAIRLKAEEFMINEINGSAYTFTWVCKKTREYGDKNAFLDYVENNNNQTRNLYEGYSQIGSTETIKLLDSVNIMTPENIHVNSFMYEPILDMDIIELKNLYNKIANLHN